MVVDNDVVNNDVEKSGLKLATPPGVKLSILPVDKAAANILAGKYDSQRLLIVARKPDRFLGLVEAGVPLKLSMSATCLKHQKHVQSHVLSMLLIKTWKISVN